MPNPPLVLIIDDTEDFHIMYGILAEQAGYTVESLRDGKAALERLERPPVPNLVLLDFLLPGASGNEVLAAARAHPEWENTPIYLLTADVHAHREIRNPPPESPRWDGIIEKGGGSIGIVRELLAIYK